jgi:single-strand DNA-binding protein
MATDLNHVVLIGRLTRDPEFKQINQTSLVNFSIANNKTYVVNNEKKEDVHYFECSVWGKLADVIKQYATKGTQIMVQGRLEQDTWDSPEGKKMSKVKVRVENFQFLGGKSSSSSPSPDPLNDTHKPNYMPDSDINVSDSEDIF